MRVKCKKGYASMLSGVSALVWVRPMRGVGGLVREKVWLGGGGLKMVGHRGEFEPYKNMM